MRIRHFFTLGGALLLAWALQACGGASSNSTGSVRLLNATSAYPSLDLRVSGTSIISGVKAGTVSGYVERDAVSTAFQLAATGSATTLLTQVNAVSEGDAFTLLAYVTDGAMHAVFLGDSADAPTSGTFKFRSFNASNEAGSLDVYVTDAKDTSDLSTQTPVNASVSGESFGGYNELGAGTYRIRVTGAGDPSDLRFDLASITLTDQTIATLVLTSTDGGVLVNAILVNQGGEAAAHLNPQVRVRLVADTTLNARLTLGDGSTTISTQTSPSVGAYVNATPGSLKLAVNGRTLALPSTDAAAGADLTLLVHGDAASPNAVILKDDNRAPTAPTKSKLRLVHGINGLATPIALDVDYATVASSVGYASASTPATVVATSGMRFEVSAAGRSVHLDTDVNLSTQSVYTVFMLGDSASPVHILRKDR